MQLFSAETQDCDQRNVAGGRFRLVCGQTGAEHPAIWIPGRVLVYDLMVLASVWATHGVSSSFWHD